MFPKNAGVQAQNFTVSNPKRTVWISTVFLYCIRVERRPTFLNTTQWWCMGGVKVYLHTSFAAFSSGKMSLVLSAQEVGWISVLRSYVTVWKSYLSTKCNMPTIRILWFIVICRNRNAWYAPAFAVILLSFVVTAEHHVHQSRGLRHSHRAEHGVAGDHALEEDVGLTVRVKVAIVIYSPVMLRWPLLCVRNACSWLWECRWR